MKISGGRFGKTIAMPGYNNDKPEVDFILEEGETLESVLSALNKRLTDWHKAEYPQLYPEALKQNGLEELRPHIPEPNWRQSQVPIIDKSTEKLEIEIDNTQSLEDLAKIKESCGKAGLMPQYMKRLNELMIKP